MQNAKTTIDNTAIENVVCIPFKKLMRFPMDDETTRTFIQIMMLPIEFSIPQKEKPFLYQVIEKRIDGCFTFKITDARLILLITIISETPGSAILYLWYLQYWCKKNQVEILSLNDFCEKIFPMGFPSKDDLHKIWDDQKVTIDNKSLNLVDINDAGLSVQNIPIRP